MRLIRKMFMSSANSSTIHNFASEHGTRRDSSETSSSEDDESSSNSLDGSIRVCTVCNTTKTPLWRTGPMGPKSLCNACGIRQMKARRAMDADNEEMLPVKCSRKSASGTNINSIRFMEEKRARKFKKGFSRTRPS